MDLYEALKAGTPIEELRNAFERDIKAATAKLEEEERKAKQADLLNEARALFIEATIEYLSAVFEDDFSENASYYSAVETALKEFEAEMMVYKNLGKNINNSKKEKKTTNNSESDADIIRAFLDSLK